MEKITDERKIKETMTQVYDVLRENVYNPINQVVGYILSEDPTFITSKGNAPSLMSRIDRDELLQELLKNYLEE